MSLKAMFFAPLSAMTVAVSTADAATPPAEAWEIGPIVRGRNYSVAMPSHPDVSPGGGVSFAFPRSDGEVDALTTAVGSLVGAKEITIRYRIDAARGTRFVPAETPDQTATISLYFQQRGDNWSARGRYASYRWYVPSRAVVPAASGVRTVTVRFDETWTNVYGVSNDQDPQGFARAIENAEKIGIAFGTASARSHGIYATGPARFTLLSLEIR